MSALLLWLMVQSYGDEVRRAVDADRCGRADRQREIVVCGDRHKNERYRLPDRDGPFDPSGETESVMRERSRWIEGGESGPESCGPVGPGGWTGCLVQQWNRERQQTQWGKNVPKGR